MEKGMNRKNIHMPYSLLLLTTRANPLFAKLLLWYQAIPVCKKKCKIGIESNKGMLHPRTVRQQP